MRSLVKVSKTIEEAIDEALKELDANKEDVEIEIIEKPRKGFLGFIGAKDAKVKVNLIYDPIEIADNLLKEILKSMNIEANAIIKKNRSTLVIDVKNISSQDKGILIGKRGNTLDSIQYIISLALNKNRNKYLKVMMDVGDYREKRKETLISLANKMAEKAQHIKKQVKLEPMNPYERRIIHSALQNKEDISTYSEGKDPYRRVVIAPK